MLKIRCDKKGSREEESKGAWLVRQMSECVGLAAKVTNSQARSLCSSRESMHDGSSVARPFSKCEIAILGRKLLITEELFAHITACSCLPFLNRAAQSEKISSIRQGAFLQKSDRKISYPSLPGLRSVFDRAMTVRVLFKRTGALSGSSVSRF